MASTNVETFAPRAVETMCSFLSEAGIWDFTQENLVHDLNEVEMVEEVERRLERRNVVKRVEDHGRGVYLLQWNQSGDEPHIFALRYVTQAINTVCESHLPLLPALQEADIHCKDEHGLIAILYWLPPSLTKLKINFAPKLVGVDYGGILQRFPHLRDVTLNFDLPRECEWLSLSRIIPGGPLAKLESLVIRATHRLVYTEDELSTLLTRCAALRFLSLNPNPTGGRPLSARAGARLPSENCLPMVASKRPMIEHFDCLVGRVTRYENITTITEQSMSLNPGTSPWIELHRAPRGPLQRSLSSLIDFINEGH